MAADFAGRPAETLAARPAPPGRARTPATYAPSMMKVGTIPPPELTFASSE
jgi:hypothetical protein